MTLDDELLGHRLAAALGDGPSELTIKEQRARLLESLASRQLRGSRWPAFALPLAAAAALMLVAGGLFWANSRSALHATWGGQAVFGRSDFEASASKPQPLDFSDGSQLLLEPDTSATLVQLDQHTAALTLNDGHILASIRKHTGITWTLSAGPYRVRVVGTRFTVDWDRGKQTLRVAVREGRVRVWGGSLAAGGVSLDAGALLEQQVAVTDPESARISPEPASPVADAWLPADPPLESSRSASRPSFSGEPTWSALASRGKYREALAAAEKFGFERLLAEASENDLLLLANSARYSGNAPRAHQAELKLRERFAGRKAAALAAFYLARAALDADHRPTDAVAWFQTFLGESPSGDLAALARANLMSILLGMGQRTQARRVAEDYLRYSPNGAQAAHAQELVREPTAP